MRETADQAITREIQEELKIDCKIIRPLWLSQSFFNEDVDKIDYHELCIYYLIELLDKELYNIDFFNESFAFFEIIWNFIHHENINRNATVIIVFQVYIYNSCSIRAA